MKLEELYKLGVTIEGEIRDAQEELPYADGFAYYDVKRNIAHHRNRLAAVHRLIEAMETKQLELNF